ncbi:hypothetical protein HJFPF1_12106 [Paramyrothecium foliicola]|nr:hypothetical protein HJFPF1_12106 [Paramyrothecium foliicola]
MAHSQIPPGQVPLLRFPRELRNLIYARLLVRQDPIVVLSEYRDGFEMTVRGYQSSNRERLGFALAVMTANKQIHDEAVMTLYSRNSFRFFGDSSFPHFLQMIGPAQAALLRSLEARYPGLDDDSTSSLLGHSTSSADTNLVGLARPQCDLIVVNCSGLTSITMTIDVTRNALARMLKGPVRVGDMEAGIEAVDASLRNISSLKKITAKIYERDPDAEPVASVVAAMRRHGWTVRACFWGIDDKLMKVYD